MSHYIVLTIATIIILFLLWRIWKKTGEIAFVIGVGMIYYWSLAGSWFLVYDQLNGLQGAEWGLHYYYLFEKLFPVYVDQTYLAVIGIYSLFIILLEVVILYWAKPATSASGLSQPVRIFHLRLIGMCVMAAVVSLALVYQEVLTAVKFDLSVYTVTRSQPSRFYSLHQLANQAAIIPLYLGLFTFLSGNEAKYVTGNRSKWILVAYVLGIFIVELYLMFLGNKREIMVAGIMGLVFYLNNVGYKFKVWALALFAVIVVSPLFFNDALRGFSPKGLLSFFDTENLEYKTEKSSEPSFSMGSAASSLLLSNEMFCANFSMYGTLKQDIPYTYGSSLVSLAASAVPRVVWPNRPEDIYSYYAKSVHAVEGQGYTIHHATAWYLNFGLVGVLAGAVALGGLWTWLYNKFRGINKVKRKFLIVIFVLGFAGVAGQIPAVIRGGPEGYKVLAIEGILLPALVIFISSVPLFKKNNH